MEKFLFMGGDRRQLYAAKSLLLAGHSVCFASDSAAWKRQVRDCERLVLPLPMSRDGETVYAPQRSVPVGLAELADLLQKGQLVFAGMPEPMWRESVRSKGIELYDYYENEALLFANAAATAEGVLFEIIGATDTTVCGSSFLITGYGRTASALAPRLRALGGKVTVAARAEKDRICAESNGCKAVSLDKIEEELPHCDVLINTVPSRIIEEKHLLRLKRDALVLEIASAPYGADEETVKQCGLRYLNAPGLPGRLSPRSAGEAISRAILSYEKEGEVRG
ncbi:MAG: hypothetical protein IJU96_04130 [Clostridia bacterium]|nr:hypothetical protein [Clostridia bacterium]